MASDMTSSNTPAFSASDLRWFREGLGLSLAGLADALSKVSGRTPPYTRGYVSNLEREVEGFPITPEIVQAVRRLHTLHQSEDLPQLATVEIQADPMTVEPGAIYAGSSRRCRWPDCRKPFIPSGPSQKQCPECKVLRRKGR